MKKKVNSKRFLTRLVLLTIAVVLVVCLSACTLFAGLAGIVIDNATDTLYDLISNNFDKNAPNNAVYGSENGLAIGFADGHMHAFWDSYGSNYSYKLKIIKNNGTALEYENIENRDFDLEENGYTYSDNLQLFLYRTTQNQPYELVNSYLYNGIDKDMYDEYSANMSGGWDNLDTYLATRYEFFELYNYLVIFRPNMEITKEDGTTYYNSKLKMYFGYDYWDLYTDLSIEDSYKTEIASAIAAFEDSAGYSYSYEIGDDNRSLTMYLRFDYDTTPTLESSTNKHYERVSAESGMNSPHYVLSETTRVRNFPIDLNTRKVEVESSDQLYFALKKGYSPDCIQGSNAEYLYNYMRNILARINGDITPDAAKIHYIYDYIVDTVLYDYEFTDELDEENDSKDLFSYKCLYLEGVFGMQNNHSFDNNDCVAICDGISKAVLSMLTIEGIDVIKISGESKNVAHAWNKVKLGNNWYMLDATWGNVLDQTTHEESFSHDYLLVADDSSHQEDQWIYYPDAPFTYSGYSFR